MQRKRTYLIRLLPDASSAPEELDQLAHGLFKRSRQEMIAEAAYYRAERRGFQGGSRDEDWLAAEAEIERLLRDSRPSGIR